jgi:ADP-ribose pyrophosphatase YjhB (NUDIX family)
MPTSQYKYPKFHVAVDCIIFGYENEELKLLLSHRRFQPGRGAWSLMGGWVREKETVEKAAERILFQVTGLKDIYLEQVHVFSEPDRDPGGRVISVTFYAMIRIDKHDKELVKEHGAEWWPIDQKPVLVFDHNQMVENAHEKLKIKASYELIGKNLLPSKFTILQLRTLYEAIFQRSFDPGNFRKKILSLKVLERLNEKNTMDSKKGAYYYRFKKPSEEFIQDRIVKY